MDLQRIVAELRSEMDRIGHAIGLLGGNAPEKKRVGRPPGSGLAKVQTKGRGHSLTPAARHKLSEAMKLRWAQRRGSTSSSKASVKATAAKAPKKKGGMSEQGRKNIAAAMRKRWAEKRKASSD